MKKLGSFPVVKIFCAGEMAVVHEFHRTHSGSTNWLSSIVTHGFHVLSNGFANRDISAMLYSKQSDGFPAAPLQVKYLTETRIC